MKMYWSFKCTLILVGIAGGLTKLSKMPSCNLLILGSQKKILSGFSQVAMLPHTGYVYFCDLVQDNTPPVLLDLFRLIDYSVQKPTI
jgi:U4/U6 small nuclear ribonucleoprotein PRP31